MDVLISFVIYSILLALCLIFVYSATGGKDGGGDGSEH